MRCMNAFGCVRSGTKWLLALVLVLFVSPAVAEKPFRLAADPGHQPRSRTKLKGISLEQATNIVRRRTGGRVLSATPSDRGRQRGFEVRVLVGGKRVKKVFVDAKGNLRD